MQTAVQKIIEQIDEEVQVLSNLYGSEIKGRLIALAFAKKRCLEVLELEKQQIIDIVEKSRETGLTAEYLLLTYGSKGSDDHIVDTNEMVEDTFKVWECCGMEECICKGSDVEKLAEIEYPIFDGDLLGIAHNQKHSRIDFIKGYNKAKETLYTEEQVIEFTKWLASEWFSMWVKDKFVWEHDWEENQEGQKYQGYYTEKQLLDLFQSLKNKL